MRYLLDTNVHSELRKPAGRIDPNVDEWTLRTPASEIALTVVSVFEIARGIAQLQRRDSLQAARLQRWLDRILADFHGRVLDVDTAVMVTAGRLHAPDPRPSFDSLIAATAIVHGLTVVTRNVKDFEPMGVPVINPWEAA